MIKWVKDTWRDFLEPFNSISDSAAEGLGNACYVMLILLGIFVVGYFMLVLIF